MDNAWWKTLVVALVVLVAGALPVAASAQTAAYLRVDGLKGDVTGQFADQHVVESFNFAETTPASGGRPLAAPLKLRLQVSTALVDFLQALETNASIDTATLSLTRSNGVAAPFVFQEIAMKGVRVVGFRIAWADGAARPSLELELSYVSSRWSARTLQANGSVGPSNVFDSTIVTTR